VEDGPYMHFIVFMERRMTEVLREEILSLFFRTLYLWTIAYLTPLLISYNVFLTLFASSS
jgi:hypothetical protein